MSKVLEYILTLILVCGIAYVVVTPIATNTANSLVNTAELIREAEQ